MAFTAVSTCEIKCVTPSLSSAHSGRPRLHEFRLVSDPLGSNCPTCVRAQRVRNRSVVRNDCGQLWACLDRRPGPTKEGGADTSRTLWSLGRWACAEDRGLTRVSNPRTAPPLPEPDPSDRSAPGASTMEAPHQSLFQKGPKPAQLQVRLLSHISLCTKELQAPSLPTRCRPVHTRFRPVIGAARFCMECAMPANALPTPVNRKAARRAPSCCFEGDFFSSLEERAGAHRRDRTPPDAGSLARVCFREASCHYSSACQYSSAGRSGPAALDLDLRPGALLEVCGPGREHS